MASWGPALAGPTAGSQPFYDVDGGRDGPLSARATAEYLQCVQDAAFLDT
jgi:hypothetical protein